MLNRGKSTLFIVRKVEIDFAFGPRFDDNFIVDTK